MEVQRGVYGVLAGHGVGHEEDLRWVEQFLEPLHLAHEVFVDVETAGSVDDERVAGHVASLAPGFLSQSLDKRRASGLAFLIAFIESSFDGFGNNFQLLARGGPVNVDRDKHGAVTALFEPRRELAAGRGLTGTLQTGHQDHGGRLRGEFEAGCVFAEEFDQLIANDLDDLFGGRERSKYFGANGLGANVLDELAGNVEVYVGFEQGYANFAEGFADVFFRERALAAQCFEGPLQFFCEVLKHRSDSSLQGSGVRDQGTGNREQLLTPGLSADNPPTHRAFIAADSGYCGSLL